MSVKSFLEVSLSQIFTFRRRVGFGSLLSLLFLKIQKGRTYRYFYNERTVLLVAYCTVYYSLYVTCQMFFLRMFLSWWISRSERIFLNFLTVELYFEKSFLWAPLSESARLKWISKCRYCSFLTEVLHQECTYTSNKLFFPTIDYERIL